MAFVLSPELLHLETMSNFANIVPGYRCMSRKLLVVHAAVAEVLHMIGAAETIDKILWEWERITCLSQDVTDASLLAERSNLIMAS
jgi:hypothetical protein